MGKISFNLENWKNLKSWRPFFLLLVVGFLLYSRTLFFDYTYFDDSTLILEKAQILQDARNIPKIFETDAFFSNDKFYYRPFLNLSFMLDAQVGGLLPFVYHFDNVLLHILAAWLAFCLLVRLTKRRDLSFFLVLLFTVHPVLVQAVAWIPGRNDSLLAIFVLAGFLTFLRFLERPKLLSYLGYLLFFFAALMVKESAVALPALVIFYFLFIDAGNLLTSDKLLLTAGSGVTAFIWLIMRSLALGLGGTGVVSALAGIVKNISAVLLQLGKLIFPFNLSVLPILADSTLVFGWIALALLLAAGLFSRRKRTGLIIFSILWFILFLLPSFIRLNDLPDFLEHRLYLSFIGFLIFLAELDWVKSLDFRRREIQAGAGAVILVFMILTFVHSGDFRDRLVFWRTAAQEAPHSPLAQKNLGAMYYFDQDLKDAEIYYGRALALNAQEPMVHNNLGVIYLDRNELKRAESEFIRELEINPGYDKALQNLESVRRLLNPVKQVR